MHAVGMLRNRTKVKHLLKATERAIYKHNENSHSYTRHSVHRGSEVNRRGSKVTVACFGFRYFWSKIINLLEIKIYNCHLVDHVMCHGKSTMAASFDSTYKFKEKS